MPRVYAIQLEWSKLPYEHAGSAPHVYLIALSNSNVFTIWRERCEWDGVFERDVMKSGAFAYMNQHCAAI